jgi:polyketide synthase 12
MARAGLLPVPAAAGMALLDAAAGTASPLVIAAPLDLARLRGQGPALPPLLSALAPARTSTTPGIATALAAGTAPPAAPAAAQATGGLAARLAGQPAAEQAAMVRQLVLSQAATVLGMTGLETADATRSFRELGFDSLTAVELRNRLNTATGLRLPATLVFDYPTADTLAGYLMAESIGEHADYQLAVEQLDKLESAISAIAENDEGKFRILARLQAMMEDLRSGTTENMSAYHEIDNSTDDEIFDLIDKELED